MKIIALPDLHQSGIQYLPQIEEELRTVNLVLLVGDLTNGGSQADAAEVVKTVRAYNSNVFAVPGNWDGQTVSEYLDTKGINLHGKTKIYDEIAFVGVGGALPSYGQTINEMPESAFARWLNQAIEGVPDNLPKVLVAHQPPYNTAADSTGMGSNVGSKCVRTWIEVYQPLVCFTGHIHEAVRISEIGSTRIINPGPIWRGNYAYAEINSGTVASLEIRQITRK